jgi:hypothetical protein
MRHRPKSLAPVASAASSTVNVIQRMVIIVKADIVPRDWTSSSVRASCAVGQLAYLRVTVADLRALAAVRRRPCPRTSKLATSAPRRSWRINAKIDIVAVGGGSVGGW